MPWDQIAYAHRGGRAVVARRRLLLRAGWCGWLLLAWSLGSLPPARPQPARAQEPPSASQREWQVKYAFLYSFGLLTHWPETAFSGSEGRFIIAVAGNPPFGGDLDRISQLKKIGGRAIEIRRVQQAAELPACHVLFVAASVEPALEEQLLSAVGDKPVLLVGERPGFCDQRGMIRFYLDQDSVKFELNPRAAEKRALSLDPRLLKLGKLVGSGAAGPPNAADSTASIPVPAVP